MRTKGTLDEFFVIWSGDDLRAIIQLDYSELGAQPDKTFFCSDTAMIEQLIYIRGCYVEIETNEKHELLKVEYA